MHIHCLGLNHRTASVALRERMAFSEEKNRAALARLSQGLNEKSSQAPEIVILSTCNRVEVYMALPELESDLLLNYLAEIHGIPREEFEPHTYHLTDQQAVLHLFRVAAGLESLVLGEPQILGQVTRALELAHSQNVAGSLLSRLFQAAIYAGKRARSATRISRNPASIPSLAASLAERTVPDLDQAQVVVIGAGEMAELAVEALRKRGARRILVVNRSLGHAQELASRWQAQATTFEHLMAALTAADIVVSSTGAPHTIIQHDLAAQVMQLRPHRPLVAIDIAVPRDIEAEVGSLPGVSLYDMDSLNHQMEQSLAERMEEVPRVEIILQEEEARFMEYLKSQDVMPLIADLHKHAEAIRQNELDKSLRRLTGLSEVEKADIDAMSRAMVKRLLDGPIMRLRAEAQCSYGAEYASVARTLFGLPGEDHSCNITHGTCPLSSCSNSESCD